jgi:hypothetical protein
MKSARRIKAALRYYRDHPPATGASVIGGLPLPLGESDGGIIIPPMMTARDRSLQSAGSAQEGC